MCTIPWFGATFLIVTLMLSTAIFGEERRNAPQQLPPNQKSESRTTQERADDLALLAKIAAGYTVKFQNGRAAELNREPVYRWTNPVAGTIGRQVRDAAVFVWFSDGRPAAIGSVVWYSQVGLYQEFQSLAFEPLTAERAGEKVWESQEPGIELKPLPDSPQAAVTEAKRLIQMKSLAGRFRAEVVKGQPSFPEGSVWQLRLLPNPLIRYGNRTRLALDGAIFAFCQDTDPDVFLMLEVRGTGDDAAWHYAMGPLTSREAKAWYDDQIVWSKPLIRPASDPRRPYSVVGPFPPP